MEKKPNQWKIPARVEPLALEAPANVSENILFGFLGAWCALLIGLSLYQKEIQEHLNVDRKPASAKPPHEAPVREDFQPYEEFP